MPALTTGAFDIESARSRGGICACFDLAQFYSHSQRVCYGYSGHDQEDSGIRWNRRVPDQEVSQRSSSPEKHLENVVWEAAAGNRAPCRALQNTVKWFQLWTTRAVCFLILLI
jgi:hypothetical protein